MTFQFTDERERLIHERLRRLVGLGAGDFFRDACQLVANLESLNTRAHMIGHALREIESAIFDVLKPLSTSTAGKTPPKPEAFSYEQTSSPEAETPAEGGEERTKAVNTVKAILQRLDIREEEAVAKAWIEATKEGLHKRAHRRGLGEQRQVDGEFRAFWDRRLSILLFVLDRVEANANLITSNLEQLAAIASPSKEDANRLRNCLPFNMTFWECFFSRLNSPVWIPLLRKRGLFNQPHPPIRDPLAGTIQFPPWPPGAYLARMAKIDNQRIQRLVLETACTIPVSENVSVQEGLADIALALPPALSKKLLDKTEGWLAVGMHMRLPFKLSEAISHLTAGGEVDSALALTELLLKPTTDESEGGADE